MLNLWGLAGWRVLGVARSMGWLPGLYLNEVRAALRIASAGALRTSGWDPGPPASAPERNRSDAVRCLVVELPLAAHDINWLRCGPAVPTVAAAGRRLGTEPAVAAVSSVQDLGSHSHGFPLRVLASGRGGNASVLIIAIFVRTVVINILTVLPSTVAELSGLVERKLFADGLGQQAMLSYVCELLRAYLRRCGL